MRPLIPVVLGIPSVGPDGRLSDFRFEVLEPTDDPESPLGNSRSDATVYVTLVRTGAQVPVEYDPEIDAYVPSQPVEVQAGDQIEIYIAGTSAFAPNVIRIPVRAAASDASD